MDCDWIALKDSTEAAVDRCLIEQQESGEVSVEACAGLSQALQAALEVCQRPVYAYCSNVCGTMWCYVAHNTTKDDINT